jgi:hypothetical protein
MTEKLNTFFTLLIFVGVILMGVSMALHTHDDELPTDCPPIQADPVAICINAADTLARTSSSAHEIWTKCLNYYSEKKECSDCPPCETKDCGTDSPSDGMRWFKVIRNNSFLEIEADYLHWGICNGGTRSAGTCVIAKEDLSLEGLEIFKQLQEKEDD